MQLITSKPWPTFNGEDLAHMRELVKDLDEDTVQDLWRQMSVNEGGVALVFDGRINMSKGELRVLKGIVQDLTTATSKAWGTYTRTDIMRILTVVGTLETSIEDLWSQVERAQGAQV